MYRLLCLLLCVSFDQAYGATTGSSSMATETAMAYTTATWAPFVPGNVDPGSLTSGNINPSDLAQMTAQDFRDLSDYVLETMIAAFDQDRIDVVCNMLNDDQDTALLARMDGLGLDCLATFTSGTGGGEISDALADSLFQAKLDSKPATNWDASDWTDALTLYASAIEPSNIREISADALMDMVRNQTIDPTELTRPDQKRAMADQLKTAYGAAASWDASALADLASGDYLGSVVEIADLRQLNSADILSSLSSFADVVFGDDAKKSAIGKKITDSLGGRDSAASWNASDVASAAQYILKDKRVLSSLSESMLIASLASFVAKITSKTDGVALSQSLKSTARYSDPTAIDSTRLSELSSSLVSMGKSYLSQIPPAALLSSLGTIGQIAFTPGDARGLIETLKASVDVTTFNAANITGMSGLLGGFSSSDFSSMPDSALDGALDSLGALDLSPSQARTILAKVVNNNFDGVNYHLGSSAATMGNLLKYASIAEVANTNFGDFGLSCENGFFEGEPNREQAVALAAKIKAELGGMDASNTNYTSGCFSNWGKVAAMGFTKADFQNLRTDDELPAILSYLGAYVDYMEEAQAQAVYDKVRSALLPDAMAFYNFTEAKLGQVGVFLKYMNDSDLAMFPSSLAPTVARYLGQASMNRSSMAEIQRLKTFALQNILRDNTSLVTDRTSASTLDDNDIENLGTLLCGLEKAEFDKMDADSLINNLYEMGKCPYSTTDGRALLARAMDQFSDLKTSTDGLTMVCGLLAYATDAGINNIPDDRWEAAFADVGACITARKELLKKRDEAFSNERDATQRASEDAAIKTALRAGFTATVTAARRRRRSTSGATCADITLLGDVSSLSTTDIDGLSTSAFDDCAETLGAESAWDFDQLSSLATKAVETWGAVTNWNSSNVQDARSMVAGLTASQIGMLPLDADAMASVGAYDIYTSDQLAAGFTQYLSESSVSPSTLTSIGLVSLGAFACGATEGEIGNFTVSVYYDAALTVGAQSACETGQMAAYALLAQDASAFGAVSSWDESTVTSVGSMIGGLTTTQISTLTESQISAIDTTDMSNIPPAKFAGFSATQIGYFSTSQATAVTVDQQQALSADAQDALVAAGATDLVGDSGASAVTYSVLLLIAAFIHRM